jgi:F-type H+-transporting ATPase subunit b
MSLYSFLASEAPNGKFLPGDIKEFWWGLIAFSIVVGLMVWKLGPIIKKALNDAQAKAVAEASAAETAVLEARTQIATATAELGDANAERERIVADAQTTAQNLRVDSANRTQQLVNDMFAKAQADAEAMKVQANSDIGAEVASQAVGAAEEIVRASLDAASQSDLIDGYISGLGASS